jgi:hypothetical protein
LDNILKKTIFMGLLFVVLATVAIVNTAAISEAYAQASNPNPNQNPDAKCPPQQQERGKCGKLIVVLDVKWTDPPQSFTIAVTGASPSQSPFQGSSSGTTVSLKQGSYSVSEVSGPLAKYTVSYSPGCSGAMTEGQTITCIITNTPKPATIIVKVRAQCLQGQVCPNLPVYTGAPDPVNGYIFLGFNEGNNPNPQAFYGSEAGTTVSIGPGSFNIAGTTQNPVGLDLVPEIEPRSPGCFGTTPIEPGEVRTCTWTATFRPVS